MLADGPVDVLLPDGRVLAVWSGTWCDDSGLASTDPCKPTPASAETWDLTSATAIPLGTFPTMMPDLGQGVLLADGRVLVGGAEALWVVDPVAGSIRPAGPLPAGVHADADLVPFLDGRALVVSEGGAVTVWAPTP